MTAPLPLLTPGPCGVCGRYPATGHAASYDSATRTETWFCHGDEDLTPTCYEQHIRLTRHDSCERCGHPFRVQTDDVIDCWCDA